MSEILSDLVNGLGVFNPIQDGVAEKVSLPVFPL